MAEAAPSPPPPPWLFDDPQGHPVEPGLGGPLTVSTPGATVVVATDELLAHAERLNALRTALAADAHAVSTLRVPAPSSAWAREYGRELVATQAETRQAAGLADLAHGSLRIAVDRYAEMEAAQRARVQALGAAIAHLLGPAIRSVVLLGLPAVLAASTLGVPGNAQLQALREWLLRHPELITDPAFVEAVRVVAMSTDEAAGAALGLPPGVTEALLASMGFSGVAASAAVVLGAGSLAGLFRDGPVRVERLSTSSLPAGPQGAVERLERVPENEQIRIERYDAPGLQPRFIVYVGPTETFSPVADDEPWDLTSNVTGVAGLSSGSLRATEAAMADAGIRPGDPVQFVGFSQGGLVAARLAGSGEWNAAGLETYGAPSGNVALPDGLAGMAVRHTDDFVPALAGPQLDHHLLQVERRAFEPGSPIPAELPAPAHQRSAYVATAGTIDAAGSDAVRQQIRAMDEFTAQCTRVPGANVTVVMYHAERGEVKQL